ncbi:DUF1656 domain-containing protein [Paraburkholderia sp. C35]|uniref:DUF1656 domain-containing protein n=1 Tax=Paraburkholderia sp. C35 TaxID=2126993 RepID=UPI000D6950C9|nr:DUF1656 domain-containing protein [Paraburkholderia sp. C35]
MIGEFNLSGVYVAAAVVTACIAAGLLLVLARLMQHLNLYRFFLNRYLVNLTLFVILWAGVARSLELVSFLWRIS